MGGAAGGVVVAVAVGARGRRPGKGVHARAARARARRPLRAQRGREAGVGRGGGRRGGARRVEAGADGGGGPCLAKGRGLGPGGGGGVAVEGVVGGGDTGLLIVCEVSLRVLESSGLGKEGWEGKKDRKGKEKFLQRNQGLLPTTGRLCRWRGLRERLSSLLRAEEMWDTERESCSMVLKVIISRVDNTAL